MKQTTANSVSDKIKNIIRDVPDFPQKGIIFKDITPFLANPEIFRETVNFFCNKYKNKGITKVLGIEARGFIIAAPVALGLKAGFVPVRKKGKLPYKTVSATYDLEYGQDTLQIHEDSIKKGEKVLIIDDVLATGGTAKAVSGLVEKLGGNVESICMLIELEFLKGREKLKNYDLFSLVKY